MKKNVVKIGVLLLLIVSLLSVSKLLVPKKTMDKVNNSINRKRFAMYKRELGGEYEEVTNANNFPIGIYKLNKEKSYCLNNSGEREEPSYSFTNGYMTVTSNKTIYCTLYFDAYFAGDGTQSSPYKIQKIEDLVNLSNLVNGGNSFAGKEFILESDLDFNQDSSYENATRTDYGDVNGDSITEGIKVELTKTTGSGFIPIGNSNSFSGNFNGDNHNIDNLYINNSQLSRVAFFGKSVGSTISNLTLSGNVNSNSDNTNVAGLVASANGTMLIENINNKVTVNDEAASSYNVAGLAASINGNITIKNSINDADITSSSGTTGGLVGGCWNYTSNIIIENSVNYGDVFAENNVGGIMGGTYSPLKIKNVVNNGDIEANIYDHNVGGIIGYVGGNTILYNSHNSGNIIVNNKENHEGKGAIGGLCGVSDELLLLNSYNLGNITVNMIDSETPSVSTGGLIARTYNIGKTVSIINSYNIGTISSLNTVGGIFAFSTNTSLIINNVYNFGNVTGSPKYGIGKFDNAPNTSNNVYYLNNISGSNNSSYPGTGMASTDFNRQEFVNTLNSNVNNIDLSAINSEYSEFTVKLWKLGPNGYPVFDD